MDWKNAATSFASAGLKTLGTVLGGPVGGAVASTVCGWLGLDESDPSAPAKAVAMLSDPTVVVMLREKELQHETDLTKLHLAAETATIVAVNKTMRTEATSEHWPQYAWRPFWGFVSALAFLAVAVLCCVLAWRAVDEKDMSAINMIPQLVNSFTTLFFIPGGILGVSAWHRGVQKREAAKTGS